MSAHNQTTLAALENQAFALMARMHVILRRQLGRVTDIEYMRVDPAYCRHLLDMALTIPNEDLRVVCEKLDQVYFGEEGLFIRAPGKLPLIERLNASAAAATAAVSAALVSPRMPASSPASIPAPAQPEPGTPMMPPMSADLTVDRSYIGRLR